MLKINICKTQNSEKLAFSILSNKKKKANSNKKRNEVNSIEISKKEIIKDL